MKNTLKIVHFHPDGRMAARFIAPLMAAENDAGHQTELVTSIYRAESDGIVIPFDLSVRNLPRLPLALSKIRSMLKSARPHVVFSHNSKSSVLPLLGAWLAGVNVRVYFNHGVPYVAYSGVLRWALRNLERLNCALATHVLTVSTDMVALFKDVNPALGVEIIGSGSASGIDLDAFSPGRYSRAAWRKTQGLGDDDLVVVYVGRPEKRKGFELVLRLWANHFHETRFRLVLCGPERDDVLKFLPSIPGNVLCLGFVNNVPEVLASSDLLILPSLHEGLSYVSMEAQASGAVVLANDISGIRCLIIDAVTGYLVSDNSQERYAELIRALDVNRSGFADIQRRAYESVTRFSRRQFIPAYLSFLNNLPRK